MKYYFIFLFQLIVLSSYGQKNKEAEIDSLESEMMNFFLRVVYFIPILLMELF